MPAAVVLTCVSKGDHTAVILSKVLLVASSARLGQVLFLGRCFYGPNSSVFFLKARILGHRGSGAGLLPHVHCKCTGELVLVVWW